MRFRSQDFAVHVWIRGTHVSTSMFAPSCLHISSLKSFGAATTDVQSVVVDNFTVYIERDPNRLDRVYVYAYQNESVVDDHIVCISQ